MTNETYEKFEKFGVKFGKDVKIFRPELVNLYGCTIDDYTRIGPFVEIQKDSFIGKKCKIQSHAFICEGVTIEDEVFIGHGVIFTNDKFPRATNAKGELGTEKDWTCIPTLVKKGVSIGSGAKILCGITIGEYSMIGLGAVVTKDVLPYTTVAGVPAKYRGPVTDIEIPEKYK